MLNDCVILTNLDQAEGPDDMDLLGLALHDLKGRRKGIWAVKVTGNWRVTFQFVGGEAERVNYEDYHSHHRRTPVRPVKRSYRIYACQRRAA
jgi:hypothetical protein